MLVTFMAIAAGIALAAACGLRVFTPLAIASACAKAGLLQLHPGFTWLGSPTAEVMLVTAAAAEAFAFLIPGVDHMLDLIATPAAVICGMIVSLAVFGQLDPRVKWICATIAAGSAGGIQVGTTGLRAIISAATLARANRLVAWVETIAACLLAAMAVFVPLLAIAFVVVFVFVSAVAIRRIASRRPILP